jgi:tRNA(fMet)-specific endonuclease VapC
MNKYYYLLDTCTVSDFVRGHTNVLSKIKTLSPEFLAVSSITVMELEYGLKLNAQRAKKLETVINKFLENIHILAFEPEDARTAATIRAMLRTQGTPIGPYDVLLAGCALRRGLIFVTSNTKEFQRISGLKLENWRSDTID